MPTNPFSNASNAAVNELEKLGAQALPYLAAAILLLVAAIVGFWFIAKLFGFDVGLSETAKQRIRAKAAKRNAAFPFAFSKRSAKVAAEGGPWEKPNSFENEYSDQILDVERAFIFFSFAVEPDHTTLTALRLHLDGRFGGDHSQVANDLFYKRVEILSQENAHVVSDAWDQTFSHLGSIRGLASSNLDVKTKSILMMHAARLAGRKLQAMEENQKEWAKQYGDGMAPTQTQFVA